MSALNGVKSLYLTVCQTTIPEMNVRHRGKLLCDACILSSVTRWSRNEMMVVQMGVNKGSNSLGSYIYSSYNIGDPSHDNSRTNIQ